MQTKWKPPPLPIKHEFTTPTDGFVSLIGWLTASVSDTTMVLVEDGALLGSRHFDMGNSRQQKWLRKSEQGDKWNRCLIEGMIVLSETGARDEQTTPP